jgi:hypothetical protein
MSCNPNDAVAFVDDERNRIADAACNFAIHEEILQLLLSIQTSRVEPIARAAAPHSQSSLAPIASHERQGSVARNCTRIDGAAR